MRMRALLTAGLLLVGPSTHAAPVPEAGQAEQERAIAAIQKLGGWVLVDDDRPGKPVLMVRSDWRDVNRRKFSDRALAHLRALPTVGGLLLGETPVTDAGLGQLRRLTRRRRLG